MENNIIEQSKYSDEEIVTAARKSLFTSVYYGFTWPIAAFLMLYIDSILETGYNNIITNINSILLLLVYGLEYIGFNKLEKHSNPIITLFSTRSQNASVCQGIGMAIISFLGFAIKDIMEANATFMLMAFIFIAIIVYFFGAIRQLQAYTILKKDRNINYWYGNYIEKAIWSIWIGYFFPMIVVIGCWLSETMDTYLFIVFIGIAVFKIIQWCITLFIWKGLFIQPSHFNEIAPEAVTDDSIQQEADTPPADTTGMASINRIAGAFMLIFIGWLIYQIPIDTWSVKIMWITAWIAILAGSIRLFNTLKGKGRKGAALWIAATVFSILSVPIDIINSLMQGFTLIMKMAGNTSDAGSFLMIGSYLKWFMILGSLMYIGGTLLFMSSITFSKIKSGWICLLVTFALSTFKLPSILVAISLFISIYLIIPRLYAGNEKAKHRAEGLLLMAIGFLYSLLILLNNDSSYIAISFAGLIIWLIGVMKIRSLGYGKTGTGAFITYAILMLVASVFHLAPGLVGDIMSLLLQVPAYIVLMVGLGRLNKDGKILAIQPSGVGLINFSLFVCLILSLIYLIPFIGEPLSALLFSVLVTPCLAIGWKRAMISYPEILYVPLETEQTTAINVSVNFGKHKKLFITIGVIILVAGAAYKITIGTLTEKMIQKCELTDINPNYTDLLEKITGNAEIELINAQACMEIPSKLVKKWCKNAPNGDAYTQYVVGMLILNNGYYMRLMDNEGREFFNDWSSKSRGAIQVDDITDFVSHKKTINIQQIIETDAHKWLEAAANQGHIRAQVETAYNYLYERGVAKDEKKALSLLMKAAKSGYARAQSSLAFQYQLKENYQEALYWYQKAASQDDINAFLELGIMYKYGQGTEKDLNKAKEWFQKAADMGNEEAERELLEIDL